MTDRGGLIDRLIDDDMDHMSAEDTYLILKFGTVGYTNYTDEELEAELAERELELE